MSTNSEHILKVVPKTIHSRNSMANLIQIVATLILYEINLEEKFTLFKIMKECSRVEWNEV